MAECELTAFQRRKVIEHYAQDAVGRALNHMGRHQLRYVQGAENEIQSDGAGAPAELFDVVPEALYKLAENRGVEMVHLLAIAAWTLDGSPEVW